MPDFIADPSLKHYLILLALAVLPLLAVFFLFSGPSPSKRRGEKDNSQRTKMILLGISVLMVLLMLGLFVADRMIESDREQIVRKLEEMSAGVRDRNLDRTFNHVSSSFRLGGADKARLRSAGESAQQRGDVTEIPFWDIDIESIDKETGKAIVNFRFKVIGNRISENQFICEATFTRDPDGEWRLQTFRVFPPTGKKDEYQVPGLN